MNGDQASQCRKMTEIMPNRLQGWMFRGEVLFQLGRYDEAVAAMEAALRKNPEFVPVHQRLARSLRAQGKLSEAAAQLQTAIRLDPANAEYHADLGAVFMDMNDFEAANHETKEALRRNPALGEGIKNQNILHGRSGGW
jgi:tetratricopeptide (TPR) repeat protein